MKEKTSDYVNSLNNEKLKVLLNDECLNSISYTAKDKLNQSVIGDIVSIVNVAGTKRFKRAVASWREINSNGKFLD